MWVALIVLLMLPLALVLVVVVLILLIVLSLILLVIFVVVGMRIWWYVSYVGDVSGVVGVSVVSVGDDVGGYCDVGGIDCVVV